MILEVKAPSPGESINEVEIASWGYSSGDYVDKDEEIGEIESEKATISLVAEQSGKIEIIVNEGETVDVGATICTIDTSAEKPASGETETKEQSPVEDSEPQKSTPETMDKAPPVAQEPLDENVIPVEDIKPKKKEESDIVSRMNTSKGTAKTDSKSFSRNTESKKMSSLRRKLSERLVAVKNESAMLTTFNEADMSQVISIRKQYQDQFIEKFGFKIGFITFFIKATAEALKVFPEINAKIEDDQIVFHDYSDIGIAVQTPKGLMVPVIRNVESLSFAEIESTIIDFSNKGQTNKLSLEETTGGTFTISNGGTFGSLLSTPIINPPQSAILGLHNIQDRPVAIDGKVEIRPMMYLALSYDHRIIDGKSAVSFLVKLKELVEDPRTLLFI